MQNLKIKLVQADLVWENHLANLQHLTTLVGKPVKGEVVILPEMFSSGFSMRPEIIAESMDGPSVQWMVAQSRNRVICGSLSIKENDRFYNRFIWCEKGEVKYIYNKRHLFSYSGENQFYTAGDEKVFISYLGWKIAPFICYDLRFPVWCRNTEKADLMLFVANWPERRIQAWDTLLPARAVENQCYVAGVNRVGKDGNQLWHCGHSSVYDFTGNRHCLLEKEEQVYETELDYEVLDEFRSRFPFLSDADEFNLM
ncbi:MAG: nitrilase family protein [Bacteroidetes bacterium]|nr:nitrilase family protein [Bacteroidota bacterium]